MAIECKHGRLSRKCEHCELAEAYKTIASLEAERDRLKEIVQAWYETDCPDMTCGSDGWTCELCKRTQDALALFGEEGK